MNIYLLTQRTVRGYDTYDSCVVCAESIEDAVTIYPGCSDVKVDENGHWYTICADGSKWNRSKSGRDWADSKDVNAELIGTASPEQNRGVICASFNAG